MNADCCPFCLSMDPHKVGTEKATGVVCRHEFHCPTPGNHGNPFRMCPYCSWSEDGTLSEMDRAARARLWNRAYRSSRLPRGGISGIGRTWMTPTAPPAAPAQ